MPHKKILVAEVEPGFRRELSLFLGRHGYAVVAVEDECQALKYAVREQPDLLILDVNMPAGDGFSVYDRVQRHPELVAKPVIYMTHDPSPKIVGDARDHGAFGLLRKPFELETLLETIRAALAGGAAEAA